MQVLRFMFLFMTIMHTKIISFKEYGGNPRKGKPNITSDVFTVMHKRIGDISNIVMYGYKTDKAFLGLFEKGGIKKHNLSIPLSNKFLAFKKFKKHCVCTLLTRRR